MKYIKRFFRWLLTPEPLTVPELQKNKMRGLLRAGENNSPAFPLPRSGYRSAPGLFYAMPTRSTPATIERPQNAPRRSNI